jgi:hypothetical protein
VGSTVKRAASFSGGIRLHQENFFRDLLDALLFCGEIPLRVASGHSERPGQKKHGCAPPATHPSLEMNLTAVMLGRKQ